MFIVQYAGAATTRRVLATAECFAGVVKSVDDGAPDVVQEARRIASLASPNVTRVREVTMRGDDLVIYGDFVDGEKLQTLWQPDAIPLEIILRLLVDALSGVGALHNLRDSNMQPMKLAHGEISPATVLFGIDGVGRVAHAVARRILDARAEAGSLGYLAPEVRSGEGYDARADVFGVGAMLWEALSGEPLIRDTDPAVILARMRSGPFPDASVPEKASWAKGLIAVASKAIAIAPSERFPTAAAMAAEIRKAAGLKLAPASAASAFAKATFGDRVKARRDKLEGGRVSVPPIAPPSAEASPKAVPVRPNPPASAAREPAAIAAPVVASPPASVREEPSAKAASPPSAPQEPSPKPAPVRTNPLPVSTREPSVAASVAAPVSTPSRSVEPAKPAIARPKPTASPTQALVVGAPVAAATTASPVRSPEARPVVAPKTPSPGLAASRPLVPANPPKPPPRAPVMPPPLPLPPQVASSPPSVPPMAGEPDTIPPGSVPPTMPPLPSLKESNDGAFDDPSRASQAETIYADARAGSRERTNHRRGASRSSPSRRRGRRRRSRGGTPARQRQRPSASRLDAGSRVWRLRAVDPRSGRARPDPVRSQPRGRSIPAAARPTVAGAGGASGAA